MKQKLKWKKNYTPRRNLGYASSPTHGGRNNRVAALFSL